MLHPNNQNLKKHFTKPFNLTKIFENESTQLQFLSNLHQIFPNRGLYEVVVAFFLNILKVVFLLLQGGPPPAPPAAPRGAGLSARRLCKIRTHQNVEVYGRSEDETPRKCILQAEKHYA